MIIILIVIIFYTIDKSNETAIEVTALLTIILLVGFLVIMLIFIKQSCRGHKRYQSLKGMNVFVEDKPGSLVKVLYAFQVSILINIYIYYNYIVSCMHINDCPICRKKGLAYLVLTLYNVRVARNPKVFTLCTSAQEENM